MTLFRSVSCRGSIPLLFFLSLCLAPLPAAGQDGLKVYISADMEGVVGVVTGDHLGPTGFEYQKAREWLTSEVNTAIRAARAAGATEIVVSDSHGNGENILLDELDIIPSIGKLWPVFKTIVGIALIVGAFVKTGPGETP